MTSSPNSPETLRMTQTFQILLLFVLTLAFAHSAPGQEFQLNARFYGIESGLSHRDVQCIHQDKRGVIWVGTKYGFNRFDGYNFKWFTAEKNGLQSNEVNHILEDSNGLLWLFNTGGFMEQRVKSIDLFDPESEQGLSLDDKFGQFTFPVNPDEILNFARNDKGHLIFITADQLIIYTDHFEEIPHKLENFLLVRSIHWSSNGTFWIVVEGQRNQQSMGYSLYVLDQEGLPLHKYVYPGAYLRIYDFDKAGNGRYFKISWLEGKEKGEVQFFQVNPVGKAEQDTTATRIFADYAPLFQGMEPLDQIQKFEDQFWIAEDQYFLIKDIQTANALEIRNDYPYLNKTTCFFFDSGKSAWVGTQFGFYHFVLTPQPFRRILHNYPRQGYPKNFACRNITMDEKGKLWVMVENRSGIWATDTEKGTSELIVSFNQTEHALFRSSTGHLLFFRDRRVVFMDPETNEIVKEIEIPTSTGARTNTWTFHEDKYGKIWFDDQFSGSMGYIKDEKVVLINAWTGTNERLYIYQFLEDLTEVAWLVTSKGLFTLNLKTEKILERYWSGGEGKHLLPFDNIHHMHQDEDGTFWLATLGTGLIHWSPESGVLERFTRADGLPNNTIYAIYEDDLGNFWMPTDYGLAAFHKITHQVRAFTEEDGLAHNEFNRVSHFQAHDGRYFFGGLNGVTTFHPEGLLGDTTSFHAPLVITAFHQFDGNSNQLVDKTYELKTQKTIELKPSDRFFKLDFALLAYDKSNRIQYAYRIEGIDKDWQYQSENSLRLSRLPYGKHDLIIKGQNAEGQWSKNELLLSVNVLRPFYLMPAFLIPGGFLLLFGIYLFTLWRVKIFRKQQIELEALVALRTQKIADDKKIIEQQAEDLRSLERLKSRFFANVSHELRTPLTLMLGPVNTLLKKSDKESEAGKLLQFVQRNGLQLKKLINEILDLSKLEANKLEVSAEPVSLYPFLKEQLAQFYSYAASDNIDFVIDFQPKPDLIIQLDKGKFQKILHNFLSNAMKFTPSGGQVILGVKESAQALQVSVSDNGWGIHPSDLPHIFDRFFQSKHTDGATKGGTGIGLSLCKDLADLLDGRVWAESKLQQGSTFYFEFPKKEVTLVESLKNKAFNTLEPALPAKNNPEVKANWPDKLKQEQGAGDIGKKSKADTTVPKAAGKQAIKKETLLVVEDNADLRAYIQLILADYNILTAENGKVALELLNQQHSKNEPEEASINLIISDLMMPVMDGFELLKALKSNDRWRHLPMIMLTARANVQDRLKALTIGIDDYLTKPFEEEELKARIQNLLQNYQERMAFFQTNEITEKTKRPVLAEVDAKWLKEAEAIYAKYLSDGSVKINWIAQELSLSQRQLSRRIKQLTGLTPNQYLQEMRLQKARDFLLAGKFATIKEAGYAVGFRNTKYFSSLFLERFGVTPSTYAK